jgi:hypothetical protein
VPRSVLTVVRGGENVTTHELPERTRKAVTSLAWRKGEVSWALKALQAEVAHAKMGARERKDGANIVAIRNARQRRG